MPATFPVVVICRDRVSSLSSLVAWLERAGHTDIVLLDNDSTFPPLLDYFARTPHKVVRLKKNVGSHAPWATGFLEARYGARPVIVTDPDVVPHKECPADAAQHLHEVLIRYPDRVKVGLGLMLEDIPPAFSAAKDVRKHEAPYWRIELEPGIFDAPVDTTFALYRRGDVPFALEPALRTGPPYIARHLGWYVDSGNPSYEDLYYRKHAVVGWTTWGGSTHPPWLRASLRAADRSPSKSAGVRNRVSMAVRRGWHRCVDFMNWHLLRRGDRERIDWSREPQ